MLQMFCYLISLKDPQLRCSKILFKYTVGWYNSLALRKLYRNKRYLTSEVNKYYEDICKSGISVSYYTPSIIVYTLNNAFQ